MESKLTLKRKRSDTPPPSSSTELSIDQQSPINTSDGDQQERRNRDFHREFLSIATESLFHALQNETEISAEAISKADLKAVDSEGFTLLMKAAELGRDDVVTGLLEAKAPVDTQNYDGESALLFAVENAYPGTASARFQKICRELMEAKANPNTPTKTLQDTPLIVAAKNGFRDVVRILLQYPHRDTANIKAIRKARESGTTPEIMEMLQLHINKIQALTAANILSTKKHRFEFTLAHTPEAEKESSEESSSDEDTYTPPAAIFGAIQN